MEAHVCSWSMMFQGAVMETVNTTVVSVKLSSVSENRSRFTCDGSPSRVQTPSRVWSKTDK